MKVSLIIGAYAYAVIEQAGGRRTDIRLSPGRSPAASLRQYAAEKRDEAQRAIDLAELADAAATALIAGYLGKDAPEDDDRDEYDDFQDFDREPPLDTPSLDTSFHDHEMDVG